MTNLFGLEKLWFAITFPLYQSIETYYEPFFITILADTPTMISLLVRILYESLKNPQDSLFQSILLGLFTVLTG